MQFGVLVRRHGGMQFGAGAGAVLGGLVTARCVFARVNGKVLGHAIWQVLFRPSARFLLPRVYAGVISFAEGVSPEIIL